MSEQPPQTPNEHQAPDDVPPSTLFLEMMRQAAAQHPYQPAEPSETPSPAEADAAAPQAPLPPAEETRPLVDAEPPPPEAPAAEDPLPTARPRVPIYKAPEGALSDEERASQLEAQRIRRIKRRQERRRRRRVGIIGGFMRTLFIGVFAAALASTIFTWFTDPEFINPGVASGLQIAQATSVAAVAPPTATQLAVTPNWMQRIGIVSGHRGPNNDPGAVCADSGLTEAEINFGVSQLVVQTLRAQGYTVDLLDEFDPRLDNYQAAALVSIHANDCRDYGEFVSGYLVARAAARPAGGPDDVLAECIALHYGTGTALQRRFSLTRDMTDYHTFREIHPLTPAAIIELGFMRDDQALLTQQQPLLAESIVAGIQCFLRGDDPQVQMTQQAQASTTPAPQ